MAVLVLFDGEEKPTPFRHDDAVNPVDDVIDLLDGRGIPLGARVEELVPPGVGELPGRRLRLTGEIVQVEAEPEPTSPRGLVTPEAALGWLRSLPSHERWAALAAVEAVLPLDPDDVEELLR